MERIKIHLLAILLESFRVKLFAQWHLRKEFTALLRGIFAAFVSEKVYDKTSAQQLLTNKEVFPHSAKMSIIQKSDMFGEIKYQNHSLMLQFLVASHRFVARTW